MNYSHYSTHQRKYLGSSQIFLESALPQ